MTVVTATLEFLLSYKYTLLLHRVILDGVKHACWWVLNTPHDWCLPSTPLVLGINSTGA